MKPYPDSFSSCRDAGVRNGLLQIWRRLEVFGLSEKRTKGKRKKGKSRLGDWLFRIVSLILISVMVYCGYQLLRKYWDYKKSDDTFETIRDDVVTDVADPDSGEKKTGQKVKNALGIDWDSLENTDAVAWFQMDDISYPVMQRPGDDDYYLHRLPNGEYNYGGSLFLYSKNNPLLTDESSFVYGHNMNNGSMFGKLKHYDKKKYHGHHFYLYLPDGTRHDYLFFAVALVDTSSQCYTWSFADDDAFENWQKWMKEVSMIDCDAKIDLLKKYVTLSTCNGASGSSRRFVICGQESSVDQVQEPAAWYEKYLKKLESSRSENRKKADQIEDDLRKAQYRRRKEIYEERHGSD